MGYVLRVEQDSSIFVNRFVNNSFYRRISPTSFYALQVRAPCRAGKAEIHEASLTFMIADRADQGGERLASHGDDGAVASEPGPLLHCTGGRLRREQRHVLRGFAHGQPPHTGQLPALGAALRELAD